MVANRKLAASVHVSMLFVCTCVQVSALIVSLDSPGRPFPVYISPFFFMEGDPYILFTGVRTVNRNVHSQIRHAQQCIVSNPTSL